MALTEQQIEELKKDPYVIVYKDMPVSRLNERLILSKNISKENLEKIKALHVEKLEVFEKMEATDEASLLKELAAKVEEIEFGLQKAWGFPLDKNFHRNFDVPKCICPKMDNAEYIGTKYRIITEGCPIHS